MISQNQFWGLFKDFVQYHAPNDLPCRQLQTWALIDRIEQINDPSLGKEIKDRNKPTFFSRKWAKGRFSPNRIEFDTPVLLAKVVEMRSERANNYRGVNTSLEFEVAVLDHLKDPKLLKTPCDRRSENEVIEDCTALFNEMVLYFEKVVSAQVGGEGVYRSKDLLDYQQTQGTPYTLNQIMTTKIKKRLKGLFEDVRLLPFSGGVGELVGVYAYNLRFDFLHCDAPEFDFSQEYGKSISERE
jgi:hypothetical protein